MKKAKKPTPAHPARRSSVSVAAAVIQRGGRVLLMQRRHTELRFPLRWEFPGGKIRRGESPEAGLRRELREELGIRAEVGELLAAYTHRYSNGFQVRLHFFRVRSYRGRMQKLCGEAIRWVEAGDLAAYNMLTANRRVVKLL